MNTCEKCGADLGRDRGRSVQGKTLCLKCVSDAVWEAKRKKQKAPDVGTESTPNVVASPLHTSAMGTPQMPSKEPATNMSVEKCEICAAKISTGESCFLIGNSVVCSTCYEIDHASQEPSQPKTQQPSQSVPKPQVEPQFTYSTVKASVPNAPIPDYAGIIVLCVLLNILGALEMIAGLLICLAVSDREGAIALLYLAAGVVSGMILIGLSSLLSCIRDMAINSFKSNDTLGQLVAAKIR